MRVLFISYELPPIGGGGGRAALQVARRLARPRALGRHSLLALRGAAGAGSRATASRSIGSACGGRSRIECTPVELLSFMRRSIPAARRLADEMKPTVVCAFFGIPGGPAAWRLRRRRGIPYVLSLRGSDVPRPELAAHQRLHALTRPLLRRMYRDAAGLIAVSDSLRRAALAVLPERPHRSDPERRGHRAVQAARRAFAGRRTAAGTALRRPAAGIQGRAGRDRGAAGAGAGARAAGAADGHRRRAVAAGARGAGHGPARRRFELGGAVPRLARSGRAAGRLSVRLAAAAAVVRRGALERDPRSARLGPAVRGLRRARNPRDDHGRPRGNSGPAAETRRRSRAPPRASSPTRRSGVP